MRRRDLLLTALVVPLLPTPTRAQVQEKVWRVSVLTPNRFGASTIRQFTLPELARLGFEEGRTSLMRSSQRTSRTSACLLSQRNS
jgi:putative tryptophan/tyrosine transport system substrate-binding protein